MIDPAEISTLRVGQLPTSGFNLSDKIPHEVGTNLNQGTIQQLADFIGAYLGTSSGISFRPITVLDGETLPTTTKEEWILVGKGTFQNVGGAPPITTTEELNALMSNGSYWFLGVEIPIDVELAGIVQTIRSGYTQTTPSEDAVFNALELKLSISDAKSLLYPKIFDGFIGVTSGFVVGQTAFVLPSGSVCLDVYVSFQKFQKTTPNNSSLTTRWSQSGNIITITKSPVLNNYIYIEYI